MKINNLSEQNSVLNTFVSELRDVSIQKDAMRFRRNVERIGEILAYEMSKSLNYSEIETSTPLGVSKANLLANDIVICSILRAGVPLHNGILNYFDSAENAFISAYRHHKEDPESFEIIVEYLACPNLENKTLILADPMLATGKSMLSTYKALEPYGRPKVVHLISVIGARAGIEYINKNFSEDTNLWIATIDDDLNNKGYIVPGLGDAGDLSFGKKIQN